MKKLFKSMRLWLSVVICFATAGLMVYYCWVSLLSASTDGLFTLREMITTFLVMAIILVVGAYTALVVGFGLPEWLTKRLRNRQSPSKP